MIKELILLAARLDDLKLHKESEVLERVASQLLDKKRAGQIPAGMHRSILNTGLFGESEYDDLDYDEESEEKEIEKESGSKSKSK